MLIPNTEKVWEDFGIQNLRKCHGLYLQCDALTLANVFESFRKKGIGIYEDDPPCFWLVPGLA